MKPYHSFLIFLVCFASGKLLSQNNHLEFENSFSDGSIIERWQASEKGIVLLRNENGLLPVKRLAKRSFYWESFGLQPQNDFEKTLAKYTTESTSQKKIGENDLFIFALHADEYSPVNPDYVEFEQRVNHAIDQESKVLAVLFGRPATLKRLEGFQKADALIVVPDENEFSQSQVAQLIFGGTQTSGKLMAGISDLYRAGHGIETKAAFRLGYAPPEILGIEKKLLLDSISAIVEEGVRAKAFPGAQVLVAKDGKVILHEVYGYHTYDSLQRVQPTDIYDFASVTKVTSTLPALMKLNGEGRFDLDAPLKEYLPYFKKSNKSEFTYREFLAHFGRLRPSIVFWREAKKENGDWKRRSFKNKFSKRYSIPITDSLFLFKNYKKQIFKGIRDLPLTDSLSYVYSDLSFVLYPAVVEELTEMPLENYLNNSFYRPIGANTLTYNPLASFPKHRIVPTERDTFFRKKQIHGTVHDETAAMLNGISGHAGLFGSANDLAKLVQLYLNEGEYGGERLMRAESVQEFSRCQYCDKGNRRGLGFDKPLIEYDPEKSYVAKSASQESYGHSGYTGTFFWADPAHNLQIIFFSNRVYPYRSSRKLYELNIRPRIQQVVYDAIIRQ